MKTETIKIYLPQHVMSWYERVAKQDRRTLSSLMRNVISDMLEQDRLIFKVEPIGETVGYTLRVHSEIKAELMATYLEYTSGYAARGLLLAHYEKYKEDVWGMLTNALKTNQTQLPKI